VKGGKRIHQAIASALPFADAEFDAALAVLTVHHWSDRARAFDELGRAARERIVMLTWDPDASGFWLTDDYFPEIVAFDRGIFPAMSDLARTFGGDVRVEPVLVPHDCSDGFLGAYWRRPHAYLDPGVRSAISSFSRPQDFGPGLSRLEADLRSGEWHRRHGGLLDRAEVDLGYRLVTARLG
jgi:SAM-dependent methyltransferase